MLTWKKIPAECNADSDLYQADLADGLLPGISAGKLSCRVRRASGNVVQLLQTGYAANWFDVPTAEAWRPPTIDELRAYLKSRRY